MKALLVVAALFALPAQAQLNPLAEVRVCGAPARDARGDIKRSASVLKAFQLVHPCPSTGSKTGACPGWSKDHIIPLAVGGCDAVFNLQWLPDQIKSASGPYPKDRWERKVYADPPQKYSP